MKNLLKALIICLTITLNSGISYATVTPNWGGSDVLEDKTSLPNNSETTETNFVNSSLGGLYQLTYKDEDLKYEWLKVSMGVYAHKLETTPEYFLIKTGNIKTGYTDFLFKNVENSDWAMIDLGTMGFKNSDLCNIEKVSHISEFNTTAVPEPSSMLLFGSGLIGICGLMRKWFK